MLIKPLPEDDEGMNRKRKEKEERKKLNESVLRALLSFCVNDANCIAHGTITLQKNCKSHKKNKIHVF